MVCSHLVAVGEVDKVGIDQLSLYVIFLNLTKRVRRLNTEAIHGGRGVLNRLDADG